MTKKLNRWQTELLKLDEKAESKVAKELQRTYNKMLKDVRKELRYWLDNFEYEDLPKYRRLQIANMLTLDSSITEILIASSVDVESILSQYNLDAFERGYYSTFYQIESKEKVQLALPGLNRDIARLAVKDSVDGISLAERLRGYHIVLAEKSADSILNGITLGKSYSEIAKQIAEEAGVAQRRAMTLARTEGGRLRTQADLIGQREASSMGIKLTKRWVSTLDSKTRSTHQVLDGKTIGIDEEFVSNGHRAQGPRLFNEPSQDINCRCRLVSDIEDIPPSVRRDNITEEVIRYQTYEQWLKNRVAS